MSKDPCFAKHASGASRLACLPTFALLVSVLAPVSTYGAEQHTPQAAHKQIARIALAAEEPAAAFVPNTGRFDNRVAYSAHRSGVPTFVTKDGALVYVLADRSGGPAASLVERFAAGGVAQPNAAMLTPTRVSYFTGPDTASWQRDLPSYAALDLGAVWPGVAVRLQAGASSVEKVYTVAPGALASRIRMTVSGALRLRLAGDGALQARTMRGAVRFSPPVAYQTRADGRRDPVAVHYTVHGNDYGFRLGRYDLARAVVIDPVLQSTYLGGLGAHGDGLLTAQGTANTDAIQDVSIDPVSGDVYAVASTATPSFPGTAGGAIAAIPTAAVLPQRSALVLRYSADLKQLLQATYYGGNRDTIGRVILATGSDVYVSGRGGSQLPGLTGGAIAAQADAIPGSVTSNSDYIAKFSSSLTTLRQATLLNNSLYGQASVQDMVLHANGDLYAAGISGTSGPYALPATTGALQPALAGGTDAFVMRLSSDLTSIKRATYLGGSGTEGNVSLAFKASTGDLYVSGSTTRLPGTTGDFPGARGGAMPVPDASVTFSINSFGFAARLSADLATLRNSTYIYSIGGGAELFAMAIHPANGDVYVAGTGGSAGLPALAGGAQPTGGGPFLSRLNDSLTAFVQSTLYATSSTYIAIGRPSPRFLALHPITGDVYLFGLAAGVDLPATSGAAIPSVGHISHAGFIARFNSGLTRLLQTTYASGSGPITDYCSLCAGDVIYAGAVHPRSGEVYVTGYTSSPVLPALTGGSVSVKAAGMNDGFAMRMSADLAAAATAAPGTLQFSAPTFTVAEAGGLATISVVRSGGSSGAVTVDVATGGGTATPGDDYTPTATTLSFADGDAAPKTVSIPIIEDTRVEGDETVGLTLTNATGGATLGVQSTAVLTIVDNDTAPPPSGKLEFSSAAYTVAEGTPNATITVIRTGGSVGAISVRVSTANGTAFDGSDYTGIDTLVAFADGDTVPKTVTIPIIDDSAVEGDETVKLALTAQGSTLLGLQSTATLTIIDNDVAAPAPPASSPVGPTTDPDSGNGGGGGCAILPPAKLDSKRVDPILPAVALLALAAVFARRRRTAFGVVVRLGGGLMHPAR